MFGSLDPIWWKGALHMEDPQLLDSRAVQKAQHLLRKRRAWSKRVDDKVVAINQLTRGEVPPTVKQHMAAIRILFSWLTEKGVLAMNPAREVKTERFSRTFRRNRAWRALPSREDQ